MSKRRIKKLVYTVPKLQSQPKEIPLEVSIINWRRNPRLKQLILHFYK